MDTPVPPKTKRSIQFSAGMIALFGLFGLGALVFVKLAGDVVEHDPMPLDTAILEAIHRTSTPFFDVMMPILTNIGGPLGTVLLTVLVAALFILKNERRRAFLVFVSVAGAAALNVVLKSIFVRDRPELWTRLVTETSYSFPSGHAMASAALGLALSIALWNSRWRWWGVASGMFYMVFISYTRLYLGVHYPSDILGGWGVAAAWVAIVALMVYSRLGRAVIKP